MKNRCCMKTKKGRGVVCVGGDLESIAVEEEAPLENTQIRTALPQVLDPEDEH